MNRRGFTFLESLVAIGLAGLIFTGAVGTFFISNQGSAEGLTRQRALWYAQEGMEAVSTMSFSDLAPTAISTLSFSEGQWLLISGGPEDLGGGLERTIAVEAVQRDEDCDVVTSGTVDPDSYKLVSTVSWDDLMGEDRDVTLASMRTNWEAPTGSCFGARACEDFSIDLSSANWHGGKQLRDVFIENLGSSDVEIDKITFTWDNSNLIQQVFLDSDKVWSSYGPGSPSGNQPSDTELDIEDEDIEDEETAEMHKVQFNDTMAGSTISFTLECTDGSTIDSGNFIP